jgi:catechol 2,3-dioxygenase-like lactoylglutathione lyase family enzyme
LQASLSRRVGHATLDGVLTGIDHVIIVAPDPDATAQTLEEGLGLRVSGGGRHTAHGSFNRLIWLGDTYIELAGIADRALAELAWFGPHALAALDRAGGGYIGMSVATNDLLADVGPLRERGSAMGEPESGERVRPDGRVVRWRLASVSPPDPDAGLLFVIEHDTSAAEWTSAERAARAREVHPLGTPARLVRLELPVEDMRAATMRVHRDLGVAFRPSLEGGGARDGAVGSQTLRLAPAAPGRVPTIVVRGGTAPREAELLGCRFLVLP